MRRFAILVLAAAGCVPRTEPQSPLCAGASESLPCLQENFEGLYRSDYGRFWRILHESARRARECSSPAIGGRFMSLSLVEGGNAEYSEFLAKAIESWCVESPVCFRNAHEAAGPRTRQALRRLLSKPMFEDPSRIMGSGCMPEPPAP